MGWALYSNLDHHLVKVGLAEQGLEVLVSRWLLNFLFLEQTFHL